MECPQCFRQNAPGSNYCIYCGAAMSWKVIAVSVLVFLLIVAVPVPVAVGAVFFFSLSTDFDVVALLLLEAVVGAGMLAVFLVLKRKKIRPGMALAGIVVSALMLVMVAGFLLDGLKSAVLQPVLKQVKPMIMQALPRPTVSSEVPDEPPVATLTVEELFKQYSDAKYLDKVVAVSGVVEHTDTTVYDETRVYLRMEGSGNEVVCNFRSPGQIYRVSQLALGDSITVVGTCRSRLLWRITLRECQVQ